MRHTIFLIPGTGDVYPGMDPDTPIGVLALYHGRLDPDVFDLRFVDYPASFGSIPVGVDAQLFLGAPTYIESRDQGVAEVKRLIEETPGTFGLIGFSQGGAVADLVVRDLVEGDLQHRQKDCIWAHVFASPHRAKGRSFHLDNPRRLPHGGIAGDPVVSTGSIDYFAYANPSDAFTHCDQEWTYGREIYEIVKHWKASDPREMFREFADLHRSLTFLSNLNLRHFGRVINTVRALRKLLTSGAHIEYFDHRSRAFGGTSAFEHSVRHLNHWGPAMLRDQEE